MQGIGFWGTEDSGVVSVDGQAWRAPPPSVRAGLRWCRLAMASSSSAMEVTGTHVAAGHIGSEGTWYVRMWRQVS